MLKDTLHFKILHKECLLQSKMKFVNKVKKTRVVQVHLDAANPVLQKIISLSFAEQYRN